jgi:hypothetical protein
MIVRALLCFDFIKGDDHDRQYHMNPGDVMTIEDVNQAQSFINSGYVVEVVACQTCGSYVEKA